MPPFIPISCFLVVFGTLCYLNYNAENSQIISAVIPHSEVIAQTEKGNLFSQCKLPKYNPWDEELLPYVDFHKTYNCPELHEVTKLEKGRIVVLDEDYFCWGRCIRRKTDKQNTYDNWRKADNGTFDCDFVETRCSNGTDNIDKADYIRVHTQIFKTISSQKSTIRPHKYNLFVFVFDSTGMSQAYRNFPKTMNYLTNGLEAVKFPYVNKVHSNSWPNAIPLWFGKQVYTIDRFVFGEGTKPPDLEYSHICDQKIKDSEGALMTEFRNAGYTTLFAEDYKASVFASGCAGFENQIGNHTFELYMNRMNYAKLADSTCGMNLQKKIYNYTQQFIDAYPKDPKFSWIWLTNLSHNNEDTVIPFDSILFDFLLKNQRVMENSFVVLMADHGLRFGKVSTTRLGALDNNNPAFVMSVPKELRGSEIHKRMRENAKQLQTHYDTRATFLDILKYQQASNFTSDQYFKLPNEKGSSYFRQQIGERNCATLPIPFQFCLCEYEMRKIDLNSFLAIEIGKAVIDSINNDIKQGNLTKKCPLWEFGKVVSLDAYGARDDSSAFKVQVSASKPYPNALFRTTVLRNRAHNHTVGSIDRVDSYGKMGDCAPTAAMKQYCHCKS